MLRPDIPSEGFPWARVKAAKRYLYALRPWWSPIGERMTIVPISMPAPLSQPFGGLTSTDKQCNLYIDRQFANNAEFHVLSGAIEHSLQNHVRGAWSRMTWMEDVDKETFFNVCMDMEINSAIMSENEHLDMEAIRAIIEMSSQFSPDDLVRWNVIGPPGLGEHGWTPDMLEMPPGKSAETYYKIIRNCLDQDSSGKGSNGSGDDGENGSPEDSEVGEQGGAENSTGSDSQDQSDDKYQPEDAGSDEESKSDRGDQDSDSDQGDEMGEDGSQEKRESKSSRGDGEGDQEQSDGDSEQPESGSDAAPSPGGDDGIPSDDDASEDKESNEGDGGETNDKDSDGSDSSGSGSEGSGDSDKEPDSDSDTPGDASNSSDAKGGSSEGGNEGDGEESPESNIDREKAFEELSRKSPSLRWWNQEIPQGEQEPQWMNQDDQNSSQSITQEDMAEFANEVLKSAQGSNGFGIAPGDSLIDLSLDHLEKSGIRWTSRLEKLISSNVSSARTMGGADLSYSVRNPNQQRKGPVLMGMYASPPKVMVLMDVSGSMLRYMDTVFVSFQKIVKDVTSRYGDSVTWITADTRVVDVGKTFKFTERDKSILSRGFGGTSFGSVIELLAKGQFSWEGKKYPKPDVLIILTDCVFLWPQQNARRLKPHMKVIVASVKPLEFAEPHLPDWVDRKRMFVETDTF